MAAASGRAEISDATTTGYQPRRVLPTSYYQLNEVGAAVPNVGRRCQTEELNLVARANTNLSRFDGYERMLAHQNLFHRIALALWPRGVDDTPIAIWRNSGHGPSSIK